MPRKKLVATEGSVVDNRSANLSKLSTLVKRWGENKTQADALKKLVDTDAAEIKQIMLDEKLDSSISDNYKASLSFQEKESIDEEGLLAYIKSVIWNNKGSMHCPYIKTVEVIDWDAIEQAVYNGEITKEQVLGIDNYRSIKKTPVLRLIKAKKEA